MLKTMAREGGRDLEFFKYVLMHSNKLTYLQQITVLVYGNNSLKSHGQGYLNFKQKLWQIRVIEFIFRTFNFTKNEAFFKDFV